MGDQCFHGTIPWAFLRIFRNTVVGGVFLLCVLQRRRSFFPKPPCLCRLKALKYPSQTINGKKLKKTKRFIFYLNKWQNAGNKSTPTDVRWMWLPCSVLLNHARPIMERFFFQCILSSRLLFRTRLFCRNPLVFLALLSAIATAWLCGYPSWMSCTIFSLIILREFPRFNGISKLSKRVFYIYIYYNPVYIIFFAVFFFIYLFLIWQGQNK